MPGREVVSLSVFPMSWDNFCIFSRNGYYGVSIFFVISGFLITSRLIERSQAKLKNIVLSEFYFFRVSRLFPALILLCCINLLFSYLNLPDFQTSFGASTWKDLLLYVFTFRTNLLSMQIGLPPAWAVLWSLAIEEVFYLFYPVVCVVLRYFLLLFIFLVFIVFYGLWYRYSSVIPFEANVSYFGCFDQMAFGGIVALLVRNNWIQKQNRIFYNIAIFSGIMLMSYTYCIAEVHKNAVFGPTFVALGASLYLLGCSKNEKINADFWLRLKKIFMKLMFPMAVLGALSYELYLFHMVLILLLKPLLVSLCLKWKIQTLYFFVLFLFVLILLVILNGALYFYCFEPVRIKIRNVTHEWIPYMSLIFVKEFLRKIFQKNEFKNEYL